MSKTKLESPALSSNSPRRTEFVSHFTPSLMAPEALEQILVERADLASELVTSVLDSATNPTKTQVLLVGPRGIGKTHLVTLVYHRVRAVQPADLCIAWLREDEYGVVSWLDFVLRIFRALEEAYTDTTPAIEIEALYEMPIAVAEREAEKHLLKYLNGRTLLLLVENLDSIFEDMKEIGQRKWRAWMQENPVVTTIATSPGLFSGVSGRNAPFYGFFQIEPLRPLDVENATLLLQKIAHYRGDEELALFIATPAGRARVRAVHHLAGGNFRIYVLFSAFLNRGALDELVAPFLQLLDELTPYYQGHLAQLSSQQRKIIEVLCDHRGALPVKTLATRGFMSPQTASSQLVELRDRGYVVSQSLGRESFYELREPLMRLCLEVKKQRGEPVALFVEFLRLWYGREELCNRLEECSPNDVFTREYLGRALLGLEIEAVDPHIAACVRDFENALDRDDYEKALQISDDLIELRDNSLDWRQRGHCLRALQRLDEAIASFNHALELDPDDACAWCGRGLVLADLHHEDEALTDMKKAVELAPTSAHLFNKGYILGSMGRHYEALRAFNESLRQEPEDNLALFYKGMAQSRLGHHEAALKTWRRLEKRHYDSSRLWSEISSTLQSLHRYDEALLYRQRLVEAQPERAIFHAWLAESAIDAEDFSTALSAVEKSLALGLVSPCANFMHAQTLLTLERFDGGLQALQEALKLFEGDLDHLYGHTHSLIESLHWSFERRNDSSVRTKIWAKLVRVFHRYKAVSVLSAALTHFTTRVVSLVLMERHFEVALRNNREYGPHALNAKAWAAGWMDAAAHYSQLRMAALRCQIAVTVAVSGDERTLLDLPLEERYIVREMLERGDALWSTVEADSQIS